MDALQMIRGERLIAIIRGLPMDELLQVAEALYRGGIRLMEVPFDPVNDADGQCGGEQIRALGRAFEGRVSIGAGTVTSKVLLKRAAEAGAAYIIAPNTDEAIIRETKERGLCSIPGALTPSEILNAYRAGADLVKVFPAASMSPAYIKAVRAPLKQIPLVAVGGVGVENAEAFLRAGCTAVACGGRLCDAEAIRDGQFQKLTEAAARLVQAVRSAI